MKNIFLFVFLVCMALSVSAKENKIRVVYQDYRFEIPDSPSLFGYLGTNSNILIAKYSENPGERIIGFSVDKELNMGECNPRVFFESVLKKDDSACGKLSIDSFRYVFVRNRNSGVWSSGEREFFYFISPKQSTVFVVNGDSDGEVLKIESNFLRKEEIKAILSEYL